jgi:glycosyltransferase involved in cell wall biosynthesis
MSSIDIVIPCYRYGHYLRECVQSVLTQGVPNLRILILDDASPDETPTVGAALVQEDARVAYRRHAVNLGHINTYNEGIDWTRADYMLLLSADDYLLPRALKRAIDLMDAHPQIGLCFGEAVELQDGGGTRPIAVDVATAGKSSSVMHGADFIRLCAKAGSINVVPTPTAIVKTSLLKQLGGYRIDLPHSGDLELWLRLAAHSSVGFLKVKQAVYRRHAANMSLAYIKDNCVADLEQRKAAFDGFLQSCRGSIPEADRLYQSLLRPLAHEAVGHASSAFNSYRLELSSRLCDFAVSLDPSVRRSAAWNALACKRLMGVGLSSVLRPAVTLFRTAASKIRD